MIERLEELEARARREMASGPADLKALEGLEHRYLGKKGELTLLLRETGSLPSDQRPAFGAKANEVKERLGRELARLRAGLEAAALDKSLAQERLDVTLPGRVPGRLGKLHPLSRMTQEICGIFRKMGFSVESGPELEDAFHNFDALNFPPEHPSRDSQDSYFLGAKLLRTHTSPVQVHVMQGRRPPLRVLAPGRVFRRDATDATHSPQFHQVEGLMVDDFGKVRLSDLKGTLGFFSQAMFGERLGIRLRPSFFPFTEPSVEVDVQCFRCLGKGCGICKQSGWVEILGAGMVDPEVFKAVGYDPEAYSGFAFGMGVERIAMLRWGVDDIRLFYENDLRFLGQF
jgi:phenylalanyl-tRNA synthetase alpha chain